jgi:ABC-type enterobactin transport system permease subunit
MADIVVGIGVMAIVYNILGWMIFKMRLKKYGVRLTNAK